MSYLGSIATATKSTTKRGATQSNSSIVDKMVHTLNSVGSKGISSTLNNVLAGSSAGALADLANSLTSSKGSEQNKKTLTNFWTNLTDKELATEDAYKSGIAGTINSIYEFENTISFDSIISGLTGGVAMFNKAKDIVSKAKDFASAIKDGTIIDRLGGISGGIKSALNSAGFTGADTFFDTVTDLGSFAVGVKDSYQRIKNFDLNSIGGIGDLINTIAGADIIDVSDIQALASAVVTSINSMSDIGVSILGDLGDIWDMFDKKSPDSDSTKLEIAESVIEKLLKNGDYTSITALAQLIGIENLLALRPTLIEELVGNYSFSSSFLSQVADLDDFDKIIAIFKLLLGNDWLYILRNTDKSINLSRFISASSDWESTLLRNVRTGNYNRVENPDLDYLLLARSLPATDVKTQIRTNFPKLVLSYNNTETKDLNSLF